MRPERGYRRFFLVRDDFYPRPDDVARIARSMRFHQPRGQLGYRSVDTYLPRGMRGRLQRMLGMPITRWYEDPADGNGVFYFGLASGAKREVPTVHYDEPVEDVTVVLYLTPGLPVDCGTSLWRHRRTGLEDAPTQAEAKQLRMSVRATNAMLEREATKRRCWVEIDRAGYRFNRVVAYASGMLHSATRHHGSSVADGRIYQTFRIGVDWGRSRVHA